MFDSLIKKFSSVAVQPKKERIIIIGAGEVGYHLARRLAREEKSVTVIDCDATRLAVVQSTLDVQTIQGSGANPQVLEEAGIKQADVCVAATNNDEINILACLFASLLAPNTVRLARVRNPDYAKYAQALGERGMGIEMMVNPEEEVVLTIDRLLSLPAALDYAEFARGKVRMVCYKVEQAAFLGASLYDFKKLINSEGILVAAIRRDEKLIIPSGKTVILKDDKVYFVYLAEKQKYLLKALHKSRAFFSSACIIGGGNIGLLLAKLFESKNVDVKLIEFDEERAKFLAQELDSTLILLGDAREKELLLSENIGKMDVLVAVTGDEETNILTCLLAKSLGVRDTVARVNKSDYVSLLSSIGIDHSVSPRLAAVNSFVNYIREGKVFSSVTLGADEAEILETELVENSSYIGKTIMDLNLPNGVLLLCVSRDTGVIIPQGSTILELKDHLIMLGTRQAIKAMLLV